MHNSTNHNNKLNSPSLHTPPTHPSQQQPSLSFCHSSDGFSLGEGHPFEDSTVFSEQDCFSESVVSLAENMLEEHVGWLQYSVGKIGDYLLQVAYKQGKLHLLQTQEVSPQETLLQYLHSGRPLPQEHLPLLKHYLEAYPSLHKALEVVYRHAYPLICDELIVVAYRIILAYQPVKRMGLSLEELRRISWLPFNIANIYTHPSLTMLHYAQLFRSNNTPCSFDRVLYQFYQSYLDTILLVIEEYFENPHCSSPEYRRHLDQQKEREYGGGRVLRGWGNRKR